MYKVIKKWLNLGKKGDFLYDVQQKKTQRDLYP